MTTQGRRTSIDASVELIAAGSRTREQLEQDAFRLLDAIEEQAAGIARGAAVACNFARSAIDLLFTVEASSTAEVHQKLGTVSGVIEQTFAQDEVRLSTAPSARSASNVPCA
jgi:hypothetical protein